jgi:competence protein ComEC
MNFADLYILNVGHGSCAVIDHTPSGRLTMIDINNSKALPEDERVVLSMTESATYEADLDEPLEWLEKYLPNRYLFRFILSHPDADHMEGLHRILAERQVELMNFWDLPHSKETPDKFRTPGQQLDWEVYQDFRKDPKSDAYPITLIEPLRQATGDFWTEDELQILSPSQSLLDECEAGAYDSNNMSRIIRFQFGGRSVLLPGDAESKGWSDTATAVGDLLAADVLIASHHGRRSGYPPDAVMATIAPSAAIVSAASLQAKHDATPWYEEAVGKVFATRTEGTIFIRVWEDGELVVGGLGNQQELHRLPPLQ